MSSSRVLSKAGSSSQSHENKAYEVGQPGFFTVYGEAKPLQNQAVSKFNERMVGSLRDLLSESDLKALDENYHETLDRYRAVMRSRKAFLLKNPPIIYP
jgi:hypothetical protein|tara:strand:+ start:184 stop:480 length:297 start_codon:yes stop_codon:yes gene_type:complete